MAISRSLASTMHCTAWRVVRGCARQGQGGAAERGMVAQRRAGGAGAAGARATSKALDTPGTPGRRRGGAAPAPVEQPCCPGPLAHKKGCSPAAETPRAPPVTASPQGWCRPALHGCPRRRLSAPLQRAGAFAAAAKMPLVSPSLPGEVSRSAGALLLLMRMNGPTQQQALQAGFQVLDQSVTPLKWSVAMPYTTVEC
ncbi:MAG: hypothetical protein J3K34DRAFT_190254 [Monoraphidium minutum]|nr:MAG: hypothetical protein J3K34DRAFT_190254 [Monoraphidium minutum]